MFIIFIMRDNSSNAKKGFTGDFSGSFMKTTGSGGGGDQVNASHEFSYSAASRREKPAFKLNKQNT
jgi:hypothetical protein